MSKWREKYIKRNLYNQKEHIENEKQMPNRKKYISNSQMYPS